MPRQAAVLSLPPAVKRASRAALEVPAKETEAASKKADFKLPKTLAECADLLYKKEKERYELQHKADALAKEEAALREHLIENLPRSEALGVTGKVANATIKLKDIIVMNDWEKYYQFVVAQYKKLGPGAFSLMQRRVGEGAVKEYWANGKAVPGVEKGQVKTISLTKLK